MYLFWPLVLGPLFWSGCSSPRQCSVSRLATLSGNGESTLYSYTMQLYILTTVMWLQAQIPSSSFSLSLSLSLSLFTCWVSWGVPWRGVEVPPLSKPLVIFSYSTVDRLAFTYCRLTLSTFFLAVVLFTLCEAKRWLAWILDNPRVSFQWCYYLFKVVVFFPQLLNVYHGSDNGLLHNMWKMKFKLITVQTLTAHGETTLPDMLFGLHDTSGFLQTFHEPLWIKIAESMLKMCCASQVQLVPYLIQLQQDYTGNKGVMCW